jgi:hypothetical protein
VRSGDYLVILPFGFYGSFSKPRPDALSSTRPPACDDQITDAYEPVFQTSTSGQLPYLNTGLWLGYWSRRITSLPPDCERDFGYLVLRRR